MSVAAKLLCGELAGWEAKLISPKQEERWPESKFKLLFSHFSFSVLPKQRCRPLASGQDSEQTWPAQKNVIQAAERLFEQIVLSPTSYLGS